MHQAALRPYGETIGQFKSLNLEGSLMKRFRYSAMVPALLMKMPRSMLRMMEKRDTDDSLGVRAEKANPLEVKLRPALLHDSPYGCRIQIGRIASLCRA